jgi:lycopene beta-cyclase
VRSPDTGLPDVADVAVVGGGPAGRALAGACAARGLVTALVDPAPGREWRITYGAFTAELPADLPPSAVAARARGRAVALTAWDLGWEYTVLDVPGLRAHLDGGLSGVTVVAGRVAHRDGGGVVLADGRRLAARTVVDAGGYRQPLLPRPSSARPAAEQTAYGLVVDEATAAPVVGPGEALFMDWTPVGDPDWPTFLYAIPLGAGRVLLEETSLARRPGLPTARLRARLLARLARAGIEAGRAADSERVHFPVDSRRYRSAATLGFGAAAPLVHPASGFSVATALRLAPLVADALAAYLPADPKAALAAARAVVWSPSARAVHTLRGRGLEALLRMPPAQVPAFFEVFFALPERHRWAYLTGRDDLGGAVAAMNALFGRAGWGLRGRLVGPALRPALRENAPRPGSPAPAAARARPR